MGRIGSKIKETMLIHGRSLEHCAIGKYRQINYYKDSISAKIYLNATELKQQVEAILDSAYHVFKEKANIMKDLDQAVAAQTFEDRAKKIEPYINIDNNENE